MPPTIPDYIPPDLAGLAKSHEGKFPDWVAPAADEKVAKQYAAVKRGFEWAKENRSEATPYGCASVSEWCEREGHDEGAVLLKCLQMGLVEACVYEEFVRDKRFDKVTLEDVLLHEVEQQIEEEARAQAEAELDAFADTETEGDGEVSEPKVRGRRRAVR